MESFIAIEEIFGQHFTVKDYQRGYKWETEQILALLEDVSTHDKGKYCLQPVIVKGGNIDDTNTYELIDGQQRLTTIYLLLFYLTKKIQYSLSYETRETTKHFLVNKLQVLHDAVDQRKTWENFVTDEYDNVDIFHVYKIYTEIHKWFSNKNTQNLKGDFLEKLKEHVHIIWYDVKNTEQKEAEAEQVFLNLNAGKVPLTFSELIKALFILDTSRSESPEIAQLKSYELAGSWDRIEIKLQDDRFWYFICNQSYYHNLDTRIDFILDLTNNHLVTQPKNASATYLEYEKLFKENKNLDWQAVNQTFQKLLEWFDSDDQTIYHYIGFLINANIKNIKDILELSKGVTKDQFQKKLLGVIEAEFGKTRNKDKEQVQPYRINNLHYEDFKKECANVLLLFNVDQFIRTPSNHKFPFDLYNTQKWSVEHINPQNPRDFQLKEMKSYLESLEKSGINFPKEIKKIISNLKNTTEISWQKNGDLKKGLDKVQEVVSGELNLHGIGNLALLDRDTNSALGNLPFKIKRQKLLDRHFERNEHEQNSFIPKATIDVFAKSFSKDDEAFTLPIFSIGDMKDYSDYLFNKLNRYGLPNENH